MLRNDYKPQSIRQSRQLKNNHKNSYWAITLSILGLFIIIMAFQKSSNTEGSHKLLANTEIKQPQVLKNDNQVKRHSVNLKNGQFQKNPVNSDESSKSAIKPNLNLPRRPVPLDIHSLAIDNFAENQEKNITQSITIKSGDNLANLFHSQKIPARELQLLMKSGKLVSHLKNLIPGKQLNFIFNTRHELQHIYYILSPTQTLIVEHKDNKYLLSMSNKTVETELVSAKGTINDSLFMAGKSAGLNDNLIMQLANIFGWDIDFVLDIRKGDRFTVVYQKQYAGTRYLGTGKIVAAEFINQNKKYRALLYTDNKGNSDYFTPDGFSMRKAFLRTPLKFLYISSGFQLHRFHPILKRVRPHRGIDYRAPTGTPVYAAGDGKVIKSAKNKYNGNYVFIRHGEKYVTKYLHFSRRAVRTGQRVKQGQTIGYVGMTGLAEAPHLHYEFLVNGVHRNPRTVTLPQAKPIDKKHKNNFIKTTRTLVARLDLEDRIYIANHNYQKNINQNSISSNSARAGE